MSIGETLGLGGTSMERQKHTRARRRVCVSDPKSKTHPLSLDFGGPSSLRGRRWVSKDTLRKVTTEPQTLASKTGDRDQDSLSF